MKKVLLGLCCLSWAFFQTNLGGAASLTVTWDGTGAPGSNSLGVDDNGGADSDFNFKFNGISHTSTTDFIISDGSGIAVGDDGITPLDFTGNGLSSFTGPFANLPNVDQLVLETDAPFTPVTIAVNNTSLSLEQIVYVNNAKDYAIIELRAVNQGTAATPVFIAVANDWDVNNDSSNDGADFDAARNLVYQQESGGNFSIGMSSLNNPVDQFHIGGCCGLTDVIRGSTIAPDPSYVIQDHFLNNTKPTEECDDGGDDPADGAGDTCSAKCHNAVAGQVCGNGTVEGDEECDDGGTVDGDNNCDHRCLAEGVNCGNGSLDAGEECDDGNRDNGDNCDADCKAEFSFNDTDFCGDSFVNDGATGNQVDPAQFPDYDTESTLSTKFASIAPNQTATAAFCIIGATGADLSASLSSLQAKADDCLAFYQQNIAICGNGIQNAGEECDDGNAVDDDGCDSNCTLTGCGNGIVNTGEGCDDGNLVNGDGCDDACQVEVASVCGDGVVDANEECDDGNIIDTDACSNACILNSGFTFQGGGCALSGATASQGLALLGFLPLASAWFAARRRRHG